MTDPVQLEDALRTVEPAARLVSERHLRKLLDYLRDHGHAVPANPDLPFWAARTELLDADVLPPSVFTGDEPRLLLLTPADDRMLDGLPEAVLLRAYWRQLFRAGVMAAIDRKLADGTLATAACADRLTRFGPPADRELRFVLETDHAIDLLADPAAVYRAFAAVYLDLNTFAPGAVADFFPSLPPPPAVLALLGEDVDAAAVLARSRPPGAADPEPEAPAEERWLAAGTDERPALITPPPGADPGRALARALDVERKGNYARAAILCVQAADHHEADPDQAHALARAALGHLVAGLGDVLGWDDPARAEWRQALTPLLKPAAAGNWTRAARCLYELQKIPADLAGEVYAVDLVESVRTLGRRPVKRPLPHARDVMRLMRLRAAHKQLLLAALGERARFRLDRLFQHEMHRLGHDIRHDLTPVVTAALTDSGLRPATRVEEVARDKLVAELLDRVCDHGYLRLGDLRDAVARNQLKMPDLAGPGEFVAGDPLLRADTRLAYDLDGVYRRGEIYLRALQRGSSVFFGTPPGRWLTLYLIAPFLAAFLTLTFALELKHIGGKVAAFTSKILAPRPGPRPTAEVAFEWDEAGELVGIDREEAVGVAVQVASSSAAHAPAGTGGHESAIPSGASVLVFGVFLFLVFHVRPFRRVLVRVARAVWTGVRFVLWDAPRAVARSPVVVAAWYSRPARFVNRHLGAAILLTAAVVLLLWALGAKPRLMARWGGLVFALAILVFNTPWGGVAQERLAERLTDWWRVVRVNLLPGLVATLLEWFRRLANWVERRLYAVDEWLRFRGGDSRGTLGTKVVLGLVWFPVAYFARFAFYLLIEPQINPVKHFPVVTVSHKVIFAQVPAIADLTGLSIGAVTAVVWLIPGIFGFIAWELLANWRLYGANRPERLNPVTIGSHGETMRGLLRPGFHSGTVPKLFRALRRDHARGRHAAAAGHHHDLAHAAEGVERFVERELLALAAASPEWGGLQVGVGAVRVGCQRVVVELAAPALGRDVLAMAFENRGGRVAATVEQAGWLDKLTAGQRATLLAAVRGLFDMAAVEVYAEHQRARTLAEGEAAGVDPPELLRHYTWAEWVRQWARPTDTRG